MRYRKLLILVISAVCMFNACKKTKKVNQSFSRSYQVTSNFNTKTNILEILVELKPGFHAYAPGEKIGKPVRLDISPKNNWQAKSAPKLPLGKIKKIPGLGESVVLENNFEVTQKLLPGQGQGEGIFYMQICTSNSCDRPRKHKINWHSP